MSDLSVIYATYALAGLIACFDRGSSMPVVLALMAAAFRISIAIKERK